MEGDEYPEKPTCWFFVVKSAIGILTVFVVLLAKYMIPSECEGICDISYENQICGPINVTNILFHRLEHSLHEEFIQVLKSSSVQKGFHSISSSITWEMTGSRSPQEQVKELQKYQSKVNNFLINSSPWYMKSFRVLFDADIPTITTISEDIVDITMVRDPRKRLKDSFQIMVKNGLSYSNISSFEECLTKSNSCRENMKIFCQSQTRFFCGVEDCFLGEITEKSLEIAKENIRRRYQFVGITEYSTVSITLLRSLFPTFFENLPSEYPKLLEEEEEQPQEDSPEVKQILKDICFFDDHTYLASLELFKTRALTCGLGIY